MQHSSDPNADPRVGPDAIVKIPSQNPPAPPVAAKDGIGPKVTVRRRIVNGVDDSPIAGAKVSIQQIEREFPGGEESGFGIWWDIKQNLDVVSDPQEIVLKAVPSVDIQFKTVDSAGHPADGMEFLLSGRISESPKSDSTTLSFTAMSKYTTKGITVVRVPAELIDPKIGIRGYSADGGCAFVIHPALKQFSSVQPIPSVPMYQATFATVKDIAESQVTRFEATTIDINIIDEQNQPVAQAAPKIEIETPAENLGSSTMSFTKEPDGHWRCTRLIPNVALTVSVDAAERFSTVTSGRQCEVPVVDC